MSALQYITGGNASPQGLPRVYFCCHPDDRRAFLEPVSRDVLGKLNCAIWYPGDPRAKRSEEFWQDLSQMQLFLLPVTARLLAVENIALEEFRFAIAHRIPVLPLMQESGLEDQFNKICGDLQYLDKNDRDDTAISFDEKLEKYLSSVLIGDQLAQQVRGAFDAYVFLSYRKKDRCHAQELMRLIHQNEFCRDVAIWYDEFLTPGENFNDAIREALEKSHLFVMAVTPNLVSEPNYIQSTEYPMARDSGKPILPAELVPTDRTRLAQQYEDIPACTDAHDAPALSEALLENLKSLAIRENDGDPRHNYFIGLAYLGGIDVEVNCDRAVKLITSAAEAGLPEATQKLAEMYRTGQGVERSHPIAIAWQKKHIDLLEKRFEATPNFSTLFDLFYALRSCGDYCKKTGDVAEAKRLYLRAKKLVDITGNNTNLKSMQQEILTSLGRLALELRDLPAAEDYFVRSLALQEALVEGGDRFAHKDLAMGYLYLGDVCKDRGDLSAAETHYSRSLSLHEAVVAGEDTDFNRSGLAVCRSRMAELCRLRGDLAGAEGNYRRCVSINETISQNTNEAEDRLNLSIGYKNLSRVLHERIKLLPARDYCQKALALDEVLAQELDTVEAHRNLSIACGMMGDLCVTYREKAKAEAFYRRSLAIDEALAECCGTVAVREDLVISCHRLGSFLEDRDDLAGARECYERSLTVCRALAEEVDTPAVRDKLAMSWFHTGLLDGEHKLEYIQKAIDIYEQLHAKCPQTKRYAQNLKAMKEELQWQTKKRHNPLRLLARKLLHLLS